MPILVAGPTGAGKTSFAVALAKRVGGEILCADAFQVYEGMSALTAQPSPEEQESIPHHLFACINPASSFDVADWLARAETLVQEITGRGAVPILVGGTGLYLKAFTHGLDPAPPGNPELRKELEKLSLAQLCERLEKADPGAMQTIDLRNPRRVLRALEIVLLSGRPLADFRSAWSKPCRPLADGVWLSRHREDLRARIAANVTRMLDSTAVEEVKSLRGKIDDFPSAGAIGFKEISCWLDGKCSFQECKEQMIVATSQYARRQETWFRRTKEIRCLPVAPSAPLYTTS